MKQTFSRNPQLRARLESQLRDRLAALSLRSGDLRKLIEMCRDKQRSEDDRCEAADLLGLLGLVGSLRRERRFEIAHALLRNIREDKSKLAWCSAVALGYLDGSEAVGPLLRIVKAPVLTETRRAAVHALGSLGKAETASVLVRVLEDPREPTRLRAEAAEALATCGSNSKRAIAALTRALKTRSVQIRFFSAYALGICARMGGLVGEDAVRELKRLLNDSSILPQFGSMSKEVAKSLRNVRRGRVGRQHGRKVARMGRRPRPKSER